MRDIIAFIMKNTGMNRRVDDLGRLVLPAELRRSLGLHEGVMLDIMVEDDKIILIPQRDNCTFCHSTADLKEFKDKMICAGCVAELTGPIEPAWDPFAQT